MRRAVLRRYPVINGEIQRCFGREQVKITFVLVPLLVFAACRLLIAAVGIPYVQDEVKWVSRALRLWHRLAVIHISQSRAHSRLGRERLD